MTDVTSSGCHLKASRESLEKYLPGKEGSCSFKEAEEEEGKEEVFHTQRGPAIFPLPVLTPCEHIHLKYTSQCYVVYALHCASDKLYILYICLCVCVFWKFFLESSDESVIIFKETVITTNNNEGCLLLIIIMLLT